MAQQVLELAAKPEDLRRVHPQVPMVDGEESSETMHKAHMHARTQRHSGTH